MAGLQCLPLPAVPLLLHRVHPSAYVRYRAGASATSKEGHTVEVLPVCADRMDVRSVVDVVELVSFATEVL